MNIIREKEVVARTGLGRVTIWRRERAGAFPKRVQLGRQSIGWIESEIDAWIAALPRGPIPYQDLNINSETAA